MFSYLLKKFKNRKDFGSSPNFARPALITGMHDGRVFFRDPYFQKFYYIDLESEARIPKNIGYMEAWAQRLSRSHKNPKNPGKTLNQKIEEANERDNFSWWKRNTTSATNKRNEQKPTTSRKQTDDRIPDRKTSGSRDK